MSPSFLIDDTEFISVIGAQWERLTNSTGSHNQSTTICRTELNTRGGRYIRNPSLSINLPSRNAVTFVGTGFGDSRVNYSYKLDKSDLRQQDISAKPELVGKTGVELWTIHNPEAFRLDISPDFGNFTIDYLLVTPEEDKSFEGKTMVFDDRDAAIKYDSNWTADENVVLPRGVPMKGTLTRAVNTGASFNVEFTGDSIAVYGILNPAAGQLRASYTVDNGSATAMTHFDGAQTVNRDEWRMAQMLFRQNVAPGTHTLTVKLTEVTGNQTYNLDYITFGGLGITQLNSTSAGSNKSAAIGGGAAGALVLLFIIFAIIGQKRKKYYVVEKRYWFW